MRARATLCVARIGRTGGVARRVHQPSIGSSRTTILSAVRATAILFGGATGTAASIQAATARSSSADAGGTTRAAIARHASGAHCRGRGGAHRRPAGCRGCGRRRAVPPGAATRGLEQAIAISAATREGAPGDSENEKITRVDEHGWHPTGKEHSFPVRCHRPDGSGHASWRKLSKS